jgi:hypothetical protein
MNEGALIDQLFDVAFSGSDADINARSRALWVAGVVLLADVLLYTDELKRVRLLRGLDRELREALIGIPQLMRRPRPYPSAPRCPEVPDGPLN